MVVEPPIGEAISLEPKPVSRPEVAEPVVQPVQERLPEFEAEAPAEVEVEEPFRYAVQRGDTLSAIARRYGVAVSDLIQANDLTDPSHISIGQKLIIPAYRLPEPSPESEPISRPVPAPDEAYIYTVAAGDTLNAIARRYGVSVQELVAVNELTDQNRIRVGQKLIIPGVFKRPEPAPAAPPAPPVPAIEAPVEPKPEPAAVRAAPPTKPTPVTSADPSFPPLGPATAVRALYASYAAIGQADFRQHIFNLLETTEFNAVVIDAKSDAGWITYPTQVPLAKDVGAARPSAWDFEALMGRLKSQNVYTIARIVSFKDNLLAHAHPEFAVKTKSGAVWQDHENMSWVEPFFEEVWDYNIQVALEAAQQGFDEVQFDDVRFPTTSQAGAPHFSFEVTRESRVAAISGFLSAARGQLKPLGVKIAADAFGYTCWRKDDTVIGQDIERMGQYLDVLCPMLYPSTFGSGIPGYKNAVAHPYEVVYESAVRAVERLKPYGCSVRPWIQDFQDYRFDKRTFGRTEIQAQIKGCFDSGSEGFLVWDPKVQYTAAAYAPVAS
jgi:LysM repeat protein